MEVKGKNTPKPNGHIVQNKNTPKKEMKGKNTHKPGTPVVKNKDAEEADSDDDSEDDENDEEENEEEEDNDNEDDNNEDDADNDDVKMVEKEDKKSERKSKLLSLHLISSKIASFLVRFKPLPASENWSFNGSLQTAWTKIRHDTTSGMIWIQTV